MNRSIQAAMLSRDSALISVLQQAAAKVEIELVEMSDAVRFIDLVSQEPFDLMVLDCRGSPAAKHLVSTIRNASANREAVFMIAADHDEATATRHFGQHVALAQSLSGEQADQYLRDAVQVIHERHRHYDRHPVEMDVLVAAETSKWELKAKGLNLSEGGMALQLPQRVEVGMEEAVRLSFELPESAGKIETLASLSWINNDLQAGFRFRPLTPSNSAKLSAWLNQHAPLPGASRKEIVESWLAKHGKSSDTVVITPALRSRILAQPRPVASAPPVPAALAAEEVPIQAAQPEQIPPREFTKKLPWRWILIFLLGIAAGLILARIFSHRP